MANPKNFCALFNLPYGDQTVHNFSFVNSFHVLQVTVFRHFLTDMADYFSGVFSGSGEMD